MVKKIKKQKTEHYRNIYFSSFSLWQNADVNVLTVKSLSHEVSFSELSR